MDICKRDLFVNNATVMIADLEAKTIDGALLCVHDFVDSCFSLNINLPTISDQNLSAFEKFQIIYQRIDFNMGNTISKNEKL